MIQQQIEENSKYTIETIDGVALDFKNDTICPTSVNLIKIQKHIVQLSKKLYEFTKYGDTTGAGLFIEMLQTFVNLEKDIRRLLAQPDNGAYSI